MTKDTYFHKSRAGVAGAPLFVVLHGTGGDENQFFDFGSGLLPNATIVSPLGDVAEHGAARVGVLARPQPDHLGAGRGGGDRPRRRHLLVLEDAGEAAAAVRRLHEIGARLFLGS